MGRLIPVGGEPAAGQPGVWYLVAEGPRRPDGRRTRPQRTFRGTEAQARRRLRAWEREVARREAPPERLTLFEQAQRAPGAGRPEKRDRRALDRLRGREPDESG